MYSTFPNTASTSSFDFVVLTKNFFFDFEKSSTSSFSSFHITVVETFKCLTLSTTSDTTALAVGSLPAPLPINTKSPTMFPRTKIPLVTPLTLYNGWSGAKSLGATEHTTPVSSFLHFPNNLIERPIFFAYLKSSAVIFEIPSV